MSSQPLHVRRKRLSAEQRRALILEAGAKAFAEHGYERASVEEIASGAGIAKSVVYDHFAAKEALHIELLRDQADQLIAHAARHLELDSPEALLRTNTEAFFAFVEEHPFAWRMLFREPAELPAIAQAHREIQHRITQAIAQLIAGVPDITLATELPRPVANEMLAETIKSTNNTLAAWWWGHRDITRQQISDFSFEVLWNGLAHLATGQRP